MTTMEPIRFGIIGAGMIARFHHKAIAANAALGARLVAVARADTSRFHETEAAFGVPCLSSDDLLARPDVDVVAICTPSGQHARQAIAAAQAGKHVLVEKPMALNLADANAMIDACARAGVQLGVVFQSRFEAPFRQAHEAIQAGDLGELTLGAVTMPYYRPQSYYHQAAWRGTWELDGGGVVMNQGIHWIDQLVWMMGDPVDVQARADTSHRDIEVEDTLVATLRFANGSLATITGTTTAAPGFAPRIEIFGTGGGIQMEGKTIVRWNLANPTQAALDRRAAKGILWASAQQLATAGAAADAKDIPVAGHIAICQDFIQSLREGRSPEVDGVEARRSLAAVLAMYRAADLIAE